MAYKVTNADVGLFQLAATWARAAGWSVSPDIEAGENATAQYKGAGGIALETPTGERISLEPSGVRKDGTDIVDVFAWPTLTRIRSLLPPGQKEWVMVTDEGIPFGYRWTPEDFIRLAGYMVAA